MPFEPGNQLAAKRRVFEGAMRRALAQDNADRLRRACERLLDSAADGETWTERMAALQFLAERLDGKVLAMPSEVGDGTLVVSWVMQGQPARASEVIDHSPPGAEGKGTISELVPTTAPVPENKDDGGVV